MLRKRAREKEEVMGLENIRVKQGNISDAV